MNYGTPLRQAHPAEVERFIVERVRADIGKEILPYVVLRPTLHVQREEGDVSGEMTAGYGAVEVKVDSKPFYLPFIIQNRELMPFETIRMGAQEVGYSPERLRNIILNLRARIQSDAEEGELVGRDEVTSGNGFLGTIMNIRDEENMRNMNGLEYQQDGFGLMEQARLMQRNAEAVDSLQVLEKIAGLIDQATLIPAEAVESYLDQVEKEASARPLATMEKTATLEEAKAERLADQLEKTKLVDFRGHRSGNNVYLPLFHASDNAGTFEKQPARVYHDVETFDGKKAKVEGLVLAPNARFALVQDAKKKIMTYREDAPAGFEPRRVTAKTLVEGGVYTYELNEQKVVAPFYLQHASKLSSFTRGDVDATHNLGKYIDAAFFAVTYPLDGPFDDCHKGVIVTPTVKAPTVLSTEDAMRHFSKHVSDPSDLWDVNAVLQQHASGLILLPPDLVCYPLLKNLKGTYDKDELVHEAMFAKTAAYNRFNTLTLKVQGQEKPKHYTIDWSVVDTKGEGPARNERVLRQYEKDLPYEQARNLLLMFGYSHNQVSQLFRTVNRSNRQATMPLPDVKKAAELTRDKIGRREKAKRRQLLVSRTVNNKSIADNLSDVISFGVAAALETGGLGDRSADLDAFMKKSQELAVTLEKQATDFRGEHWLDLAVLANIKHRLDKVACALDEGALLADADDLFKEASVLVPKIEKLAGELVPYARIQQRLSEADRVDATLVKSAQEMLDVLYGYATLDKTAGVRDFFGG